MSANVWRLISVCLVVLLSAQQSHAAPWDYDMSKQQSFKPNEMAREPAANTIPRGYKPFNMTTAQAAERLSNPVKRSEDSIRRGRRLWSVNCVTCHGVVGKGDGPVGPQVGVPDILKSFYKNRADGHVFAVIQNGQNAMPKYGFKFSDAEQWDLVNYVRYLQGYSVPGLPPRSKLDE